MSYQRKLKEARQNRLDQRRAFFDSLNDARQSTSTLSAQDRHILETSSALDKQRHLNEVKVLLEEKNRKLAQAKARYAGLQSQIEAVHFRARNRTAETLSSIYLMALGHDISEIKLDSIVMETPFGKRRFDSKRSIKHTLALIRNGSSR